MRRGRRPPAETRSGAARAAGAALVFAATLAASPGAAADETARPAEVSRPPEATEEEEARVPWPAISEIVVVREDVFSAKDAERAFIPYGAANALHSVTREKFIRRELLLAPGDPLDPEALAEAERRLRATQLFRSVSIRAEGTKVVVETGDNWTLIPRVTFSSKGGTVTYQFGIEEGNLFGSGRSLGFRYDKGTERISRSLTWLEPQLFGSRWSLRLSGSDLSDGQASELLLVRPFDTLRTRAAGSLFYRDATFETKQYAGGNTVATWEKHERRVEVEGGLLAGLHGESADRVIAFFGPEDAELSPGSFGPPPPPEERSFFWAGLGYQRESRDWIVRQNTEQLGRDEDFNLAPVGRVDVAASIPALGADAAGRIRVAGSVGTLVGAGFAVFSAGAETRLDAGFENARVRAALRAWWPLGRFLVATKVAVRQAWNSDPEYQIQLDGQSGVRGYKLYAVTGEGNATANVEARVVLIPDVLRIAVLGAAVFADGGISWGDPDGWWRLTDAGIGLRIGLPRAGTNTLLRMDIARAFRPDPLGRTGWLLSFSSGQAF